MRILCICFEYPPVGGGGATVCRKLNESLVSAGHEVHVVTSRMPGLPAARIENGVHVHRVRCIRFWRHYSTSPELLTQILPSYRKARALTREHEFDLIHCHFVVPCGLVARRLSRRTGLPYVLTAHGSDIPEYNPDRFGTIHKIIAPMWRKILSDASAVTVSSQFLRKLIADKIDIEVEIIANGFDLAEESGTSREDRILVASRIVERKGLQDLVRAVAVADIGWELCIAGDGPYLPRIKSLACELGVKARYLGFVDREELQHYYDTSKLFVFPSHQENFPMVLIEAMAAGCAVITTSADGCKEVAGDGALIYDPGDVDALAALLRRAVTEKDLVACMQQRARTAAKCYDIRFVTDQFVSVFSRVAEGHGH